MDREFNREEYVYKLEVFEEIIKDIICFFNGIFVVFILFFNRFYGMGVYVLYYIGKFLIY